MKLNTESAESLLSEPGSTIPNEKIDRPSASNQITIHEEFDSRKKPRQFARQYAHSYTVRLWEVRSTLVESVKKEWPDVDIKKVAELCEFSQSNSATNNVETKNSTSRNGNGDSSSGKGTTRNSDDHGQHIAFREDVTVAVIGTIFKHQPEKPSILQELAEDNPMVPVIPKTKFTSEKDTIQLEDETTRVHLIPTPGCGFTIATIVNGVVCAVKGKPNSNGKFEVTEVIFPTPPPKSGLDIKLDYEIVFVSGLEFGNDKKSLNLQMDLLFDYLEGIAGSPSELENQVKQRSKVFFVGNTFATYMVEDGKDKKVRTDIARKLDEALDQLSQTMDVFIMPGESDPSEPMLPQIPLHRCIFPLSSRRPTFTSLTNPARVEIPLSRKTQLPQLDILLSSGQNVKDALRNSEITSAVEMAQSLLRWGHICPTAPDTLPLHPGVVDDVFVVKGMPDIFAIGNQDSFDAMEWKNTKIFTIPKFSETGTVVLMNSEMNFLPIKFEVL